MHEGPPAEIGRREYHAFSEYGSEKWIDGPAANPNLNRPKLRVEKMRLSKGKASLVYNDFLTLSGIPPESYEYRLGNRSALEWIVDQYQVSTDKRSGITNDPNREDDPQIHRPPHRPGGLRERGDSKDREGATCSGHSSRGFG